jgi:hypothetical protein
MGISSIGGASLANQMQAVRSNQQSMTSNTLKSAMDTPKQFLDLLEQSVSVKQATNIASGLGINVDTTV